MSPAESQIWMISKSPYEKMLLLAAKVHLCIDAEVKYCSNTDQFVVQAQLGTAGDRKPSKDSPNGAQFLMCPPLICIQIASEMSGTDL